MTADFLDYRTSMMQWWADTCSALAAGKQVPRVKTDNVVRMRAEATAALTGLAQATRYSTGLLHPTCPSEKPRQRGFNPPV